VCIWIKFRAILDRSVDWGRARLPQRVRQTSAA